MKTLTANQIINIAKQYKKYFSMHKSEQIKIQYPIVTPGYALLSDKYHNKLICLTAKQNAIKTQQGKLITIGCGDFINNLLNKYTCVSVI